MKTFLKPFKKAPPYGMEVCMATAAETPIGAIYLCKNADKRWYEAIPYDDVRIKRFDDPYRAQKHIEDCSRL